MTSRTAATRDALATTVRPGPAGAGPAGPVPAGAEAVAWTARAGPGLDGAAAAAEPVAVAGPGVARPAVPKLAEPGPAVPGPAAAGPTSAVPVPAVPVLAVPVLAVPVLATPVLAVPVLAVPAGPGLAGAEPEGPGGETRGETGGGAGQAFAAPDAVVGFTVSGLVSGRGGSAPGLAGLVPGPAGPAAGAPRRLRPGFLAAGGVSDRRGCAARPKDRLSGWVTLGAWLSGAERALIPVAASAMASPAGLRIGGSSPLASPDSARQVIASMSRGTSACSSRGLATRPAECGAAGSLVCCSPGQ